MYTHTEIERKIIKTFYLQKLKYICGKNHDYQDTMRVKIERFSIWHNYFCFCPKMESLDVDKIFSWTLED